MISSPTKLYSNSYLRIIANYYMPVPLFSPNMDSTLHFRNSGRKVTNNREIRALRFNLGPKSKEKRQIQREEGSS